MGISDPILNCVTQVCCAPAQATFTLAQTIHEAVPSITRGQAKACAEYLVEYFDLLPKGTVNLTKVIELARQPPVGDGGSPARG